MLEEESLSRALKEGDISAYLFTLTLSRNNNFVKPVPFCGKRFNLFHYRSVSYAFILLVTFSDEYNWKAAVQSPREYFEIYTEKKISKITALHSVPTGLTTKKMRCVHSVGWHYNCNAE